MTAPEILRARLLGLAAVTALVGDRIYTLLFPQNFTGTTGIRLQRISEREAIHLRGAGGQWRTRMQVDVVAPSLAEAYAIDAAVHGDGAGSALAGYTGVVAGVPVQSILPESIREVFEPHETRLMRLMRDYFITYTAPRS